MRDVLMSDGLRADGGALMSATMPRVVRCDDARFTLPLCRSDAIDAVIV